MPMKTVFSPDHIPQNKFELSLEGLPLIFFTEVSGLSSEIDTTEMPDKQVVSGGRTSPGEFTARHMEHRVIEREALAEWHEQCKDPVDPGYKRTAILYQDTASGRDTAAWEIRGLFPKGVNVPDSNLGNEGEAQQIEWTFAYDEIVLL